MSQDFCRGCGSIIQTTNPDEPGYVPESAMQSRGQLICQRCYRITHYGDKGTLQPSPERILKNIQKAISECQLSVLVTDFSDLTGTLAVWSNYLGNHPYILVLNKSDLLPQKTAFEEVQKYLEQYLKRVAMPLPRRIILVSALKGHGVAVLGEQLQRQTLPDSKIAFLGATNVGKSSIISQFLKMEQSQQTPTVSKIPGTTMGLSNWAIFKGRNTLIDTPGLSSEDRIGDKLCPECGSLLVTTTRMAKQLWGIKPGKGIIVGGLLGMELLEEAERVLIAFTADRVNTHRTDNSKIKSLLTANPEWLGGVCPKCLSKLIWEEHEVSIDSGADLAVAGLGWVSLRGASARFRITLPQGVRWEIRPGLIGKKD